MPRRAATLLLVVAAVSCRERSDLSDRLGSPFRARPELPDEVPVLITRELPFHYPPVLYARRVQGNVTLRLHIDRDGAVRSESTRVEEPSGHGALDSVALAGARSLRFVPAKWHGEPVPVTVLFPVYFRHPEARPLPGDTILTRRAAARPLRP